MDDLDLVYYSMSTKNNLWSRYGEEVVQVPGE